MKLEELDAGDVVIKVAYSSVNFKDALAATGAGKIIRRFPCVGGHRPVRERWWNPPTRASRRGDAVIATSYDIGVAHDGGYAEYARIPAGLGCAACPRAWICSRRWPWVLRALPPALAVERMEHDGLKPANGPVIVTGATGGVGSIAVDILARAGYRVVALTGKEAESDYLKGLGATEVMLRSSLDLARIKPLDKATWAGAVDNLGGDVLVLDREYHAGRRHAREHRPGRQPYVQHHGDAVHPARGQPAGRGLGERADGSSREGLAAPRRPT